MRDPLEVLMLAGGAARAGVLAPDSGARRRLASLVASGEVVSHPGGCYALPGADPDLVHALVARARLACVSAARVHGLAVLRPPKQTHVAVPHSQGAPGRRRAAGLVKVVVHRERPALLTAQPHPSVPHGPLVVGPAEALARVLRCQDALTAIAAVDSALNRRVCSARDVETLLAGPGSPAARAVLAECDGRSQSPIESVARVVLRRRGHVVDVNAHVPGVGFVDLLVDGLVVVELDGFAYHGDRVTFREDRRRDRRLAAHGFTVLRFAWEDVVRDPDEVVRAVRAVLTRAPGWRPWPDH